VNEEKEDDFFVMYNRLAEQIQRIEILVKSSDSYVPQDIAAECLAMLSDAGMGAPGKPNTLWSMVKEITEELVRERDVNRKLTEHFQSVVDRLRDGYVEALPSIASTFSQSRQRCRVCRQETYVGQRIYHLKGCPAWTYGWTG
jgi:hypothetical protein